MLGLGSAPARCIEKSGFSSMSTTSHTAARLRFDRAASVQSHAAREPEHHRAVGRRGNVSEQEAGRWLCLINEEALFFGQSRGTGAHLRSARAPNVPSRRGAKLRSPSSSPAGTPGARLHGHTRNQRETNFPEEGNDSLRKSRPLEEAAQRRQPYRCCWSWAKADSSASRRQYPRARRPRVAG